MRNLFAIMALAVLFALPVRAQEATPDPFAPVRFMAGEWSGNSSGQPGEGSVSRRYAWVLNNKFLHETNVSTYPPQEKNKKGEVHEHRSYISYDKARKVLVLRQFHVEGFVNQFALNATASTPMKLVFDSENFENLNNKWKARETYELIGPDEFVEIFELAPPDKPLSPYSRNHFRRVKP